MHCTKISAEFEFGGHSPHLGAHRQKCGVGLRRWENQRRLSSLANTVISRGGIEVHEHFKFMKEK